MVFLKQGGWAGGIPILLAHAVTYHPSWWLLIVSVVSHLLVVRCTPYFRGGENAWMFILVFFSSIPFNIECSLAVADSGIVDPLSTVTGWMTALVWYVLILSVEELLMGVVTRLLWKRQGLQYRPSKNHNHH